MTPTAASAAAIAAVEIQERDPRTAGAEIRARFLAGARVGAATGPGLGRS
jgi:hypothetical protein